jgi:replication initiation protein RepC
MTDNFATTPFGGAPMRSAIFSLQERVRRRREEIAAQGECGNDQGRADKWKVIRALGEARTRFALSDRSIAVLEALVSVLPGKEIDASRDMIVFPSNAELSARTNGMAPATLRRHLAALVAADLILRRDSPNGKRYCRRGETGEVSMAFGFDLAPLALSAASIFEACDGVKAENRARSLLKGEITIHQRDVGKLVDAAREEGRAGDWEGFAQRLFALSPRLPRDAALEALSTRRDSLARLHAEVEKAWLESLTDQEMSANDTDFERHIQNSNTDIKIEKSIEKSKKPGDGGLEVKAWRIDEEERAPKPARRERTAAVPLAYLLSACPLLATYALNGINTWHDVAATAGLVRSMLGISPDAWAKAQADLGESGAAIVVAAILERAEDIRSPGGYLRSLSEKARAGKFSVWPMLEALSARK